MDGIDPQKSKNCCIFFLGIKPNVVVEDLSSKLPCKLSCNICNCHKESIDPGKIASATTWPNVRYWVASARVVKHRLVSISRGSAKLWEEASRSRSVIFDPYLSIIAFRLALCHWADLDCGTIGDDIDFLISMSSAADIDGTTANNPDGFRLQLLLLLLVEMIVRELTDRFLKGGIAGIILLNGFLTKDPTLIISWFNRSAVVHLIFSRIILFEAHAFSCVRRAI